MIALSQLPQLADGLIFRQLLDQTLQLPQTFHPPAMTSE